MPADPVTALPGVPPVRPDPGWGLVRDVVEGGLGSRVDASLLALVGGGVGVRGDLVDGDEGLVLVAGAYGPGPDGLVRPLPGPSWTALALPPGADGRVRCTLDLAAGVLAVEGAAGCRAVRFVSAARPGASGLRAERADGVGWPAALTAPSSPPTQVAAHACAVLDVGDGVQVGTTTADGAAVAVAVREVVGQGADRSVLDRIAVTAGPADDPAAARDAAVARLADVGALGIEALLAEHRDAWAARWALADVEVRGDDAVQLAMRLALFHLLACADPAAPEAAVGARGLTGTAYAGHVFWDTDIFVLPALAAVLPAASRAVIGYRVHRLDAARRRAAAEGLPGARYPWESADDGTDVTPRTTRDVEGRIVPIRTADHALHISADVAWAILHHVAWTGEGWLLDGPAGEVVVDTARYLAATVVTDPDGTGHLRGIMGPDEYHEVVDDDVYTCGLVRWHLQQAADLVERQQGRAGRADAHRLRRTAASLATGYLPGEGRHEQFSGYDRLEPLLAADVAPPPVAADLLLGADRVARSQLLKQPDVLMLHQILPDVPPAGSLAGDLAHYLPRTAHGSSLSPATCAGLLARAGQPDEALPLLRLAAEIDLADLTGTAAAGVHLATMGGLWQAVVTGVAGIRPGPDGLCIDPHLPHGWDGLRVRIQHLGRPVEVDIDRDRITVAADGAAVVIRGRRVVVRGRIELPHQEVRS